MTGASLILAINLTVAGFLAAAFLGIAVYDTRRVSARWLSGAYALGMLNVLLEFAISLTGYGGLLAVAAYAAFLAALVAVNAGLARLYDVAVPWAAMAGLFAVSILLRLGIDGMERDSLLRMMLYQSPYALMQALGFRIVLKARARRLLEVLLLAELALVSLHYLSKPFIARASGGMGAGPEAYLSTNYAMYSQALGTVLVIAMALLLLVILVRDVLGDITTRSQTDALSGVLNRRGFEERRAAILYGKAAGSLPVALVACDLDRFKTVNDTLGHAAGDRVIAAFGALVRRNLQPHQIAGRVGGEEFAVLLPGSNLAAARLFAESLRTAFSLCEVEGTGGRRFTASFGVAELTGDEAASEFEARADAALYAAKRKGRDRVEVAAGGMPGAAFRRASDRRPQPAAPQGPSRPPRPAP